MGLGAVLLGRAPADVAVDDDEGRPVVGVLELLERGGERLGVGGVHHLEDVPAVGRNRAAVSSVKVIEVEPSMVIRFES